MNYTPVLQQHKLYLVDFWKEFGSGTRKLPSKRSPKETMAALIKMSKIVLVYNNSHDRKGFERKKIISGGYRNFKLCFVCRSPAQSRHHIILLKNGGRNVKKNIVGLCRPCHAEIHPWLKNSG